VDTDNQLIENILAGKTEYYRDLVSRYQQKVFSVAIKITQNPKDAEDIAQETFIQVYRSLETYRQEASFATWLYRITVNKGLDWKRRQSRSFEAPNQELLNKQVDSSPVPEELLLNEAEREMVIKVIQQLPFKYKAVIALHYFECLTYEQIADQLGIANKTVESRLYRARQLMRENLVKEHSSST